MDTEDNYLLIIRCVLCRQKYNESLEFKNIKRTIVHTSKKSIKDVLTHLAKCIKGEVILQDTSYVCTPCFEKLSEYDKIMFQLLMHQRKLSRMLETSMNTLDFYDEEDKISIKDEIKSEISVESQAESYDEEQEEFIQDDQDAQDSPNVTPTLSFQCTICSKKLSSKFSLRMHLDSHAKAKRCHICGVLRRDEEYLELHMNVHEGKSENECRYCPKRYSRRSNVIRHMHLHWDKKKFQCEKCGLRFSQANLLYNHKMHHDAEEKPLICSKCDQTFKSRKTFRHHMVTHREDRPMYPCELCGKRFTEKYTLKIHSKTHKDPNDEDTDPIQKRDVSLRKKPTQKIFPCIICHKVLSAKDTLDAHMAEEHDVIGPIKVFL